jgi:hypothetical protein
LTSGGTSWTPANNLIITLSAQEKHGDIIEYLKPNYFKEAYLKKKQNKGMLTEKTTKNTRWVTEVIPHSHRRVNKTESTLIQNKPIASVHLTYQQRCSQQTTCQLRLCTA